MKSPSNDIELLNLCRNGDAAAFRVLVERHQAYAYNLAFRFLGNAQDAEDAVQESFLRIWRHAGRYDGRARFTTWLYRITANLCLDRVKSAARRRETAWLEPDGPGAAAAGDDPHQALEDSDAVDWVHRFVGGLPARQRMVFLLRDVQNLEAGEVAQALGLSKAAVKSHLHLARRTLRERLVKIESVKKAT